MHKSPVRGLDKSHPSNAKVHLDISGTLKEIIKKNTFALHLLDGKAAFSKEHVIPSKSKVSSIVRGFISKFNDNYTNTSISVRMMRADNERENIPKDLQDFCTTNGINIEPSPAYAPYINCTAERLVQ